MSAPRTSVKLFLTNATSSVITRALQLTVLVWVNQELLRQIPASEYQLLPVVMSLLLFGQALKNLFIGGLSRYLVETDARGDEDGITRIVSSMMPVLGTVGAFLALAGALGAWQIEHLINIEPQHVQEGRVMLCLLVATMCLQVVFAPMIDGLFIRQRFTTLNMIELGSEVVRVAILLALLLGLGPRVMWLAVASTIAAALRILVRMYVTRRLIPAIRFKRSHFSWKQTRELLNFGAWTSTQSISDLIENSAPALLLNRFSTPLQVACYHLGDLPGRHFRRVAEAALIPAQPALTSVYAQEGAESVKRIYYRGGRYQLWAVLTLLPPMIGFGGPIIDLYVGAKYATAVDVIAINLAAWPFMFASAMFYRVSYAIGEVRAFYSSLMVIRAAQLAAMALAVAYLHSGAVGMALANAGVTGVLHLVYLWPLGLRFVDGSWRIFLRETVLRGVAPLVAALPVAIAVAQAVPLDSWLRVILATSVSMLAYFGVLLTLCLDDYDRELFGRVVRKLRTKIRGNRPPLVGGMAVGKDSDDSG